jgi:hypothetical protein
MSDRRAEAAQQATDKKQMVVGLLAAPGLPVQLAEQLGRELPGYLSVRLPEFSWTFVVREEPLAGTQGNGKDLVEIARKRLLAEEWKLVICLTDLPLHVGRRPVTAHASVALGVGVVSVPALGAINLHQSLRRAVISLIEALAGERVSGAEAESDAERRARLRKRLEDLSAPVGQVDFADNRTLRFVTATTQGNVRLLLGMVRANRPWRFAAGLSRALVASLGTAAFALTSPGIWMIAAGMGLPQMLTVAVASVAAISVSLIAVHGLWERSAGRSEKQEARRRIMLFNTTTTITILIGVLTLYATLFVINAAVALLLITPAVLEKTIHHPVHVGDYLWLAWLASSMAAVGGALGAALENNAAVREAAYGYHPDERIETERHRG